MRQEKQLLLDEIKEHIEQSPSFLMMRYFGLNANQTGELRAEVEKAGGEVQVVPKRTFRKAAGELDIDLDQHDLSGHIGLVLAGDNALSTTKVVYEFSGDCGDAIEIIGGRIDGQMYSSSEMEMLSKLPSQDVMRSQLLSVFAAPMSQTLSVMQSLLCSVMYCLDNKVKKS